MSVTITLNDELASRLQVQAKVLDLSLEEWALEVLAKGTGRLEDPALWKKLNSRRLTLIQRRREKGLTPREEAEFAELQSLVERVFEPMDRRRLDYLKQLASHIQSTRGEAHV